VAHIGEKYRFRLARLFGKFLGLADRQHGLFKDLKSARHVADLVQPLAKPDVDIGAADREVVHLPAHLIERADDVAGEEECDGQAEKQGQEQHRHHDDLGALDPGLGLLTEQITVLGRVLDQNFEFTANLLGDPLELSFRTRPIDIRRQPPLGEFAHFAGKARDTRRQCTLFGDVEIGQEIIEQPLEFDRRAAGTGTEFEVAESRAR